MTPARSIAAAALFILAGASQPFAESAVKAGQLDCVVLGENEQIFKDTITLSCTYSELNSEKKSRYDGRIDRTGLSLGDITSKNLTWIVATIGSPENVRLDGTYLGADAGVSLGQGAGADYLVGGFNKKISLQPYALEGDSGFGLSLSGQKLTLVSR
jgi:hypothetical protein